MGKKITALDAAATLAATDLVAVVVDPSGTPITKRATIAQLAAGVVSSGAFGSRPAAGTAGRLYLASDAPLLSYDNGSAWSNFQLGSPPLTVPPAVSTFTAINAGGRTTTSTDSYGGILMVATDGTTAEDYRLRKKTAPVAAYTFTVHMVPTLPEGNYPGAGICWRASATGNTIFFGVLGYASTGFGGLSLMCRYCTASSAGASPTFTSSADKVAIEGLPFAGTGGIWLRMIDDLATTRTFQISADGINFVTILSEARTTSITPDEIGLWIAPRVASNGATTAATAWFNSYVAA